MNKNGSKWIRRSTRLAIYLRDEFCCQYCFRDLSTVPKLITLDHVLPRCLNGRYNDKKNLVTACKQCNNMKADRELSDTEYEALRPQLEKPLERKKARDIINGKESLGIALSWL